MKETRRELVLSPMGTAWEGTICGAPSRRWESPRTADSWLRCVGQESPEHLSSWTLWSVTFLKTIPPSTCPAHGGLRNLIKGLSEKPHAVEHLLLACRRLHTSDRSQGDPASSRLRQGDSTSKGRRSIKETAFPGAGSESHFQHRLLWLVIRSQAQEPACRLNGFLPEGGEKRNEKD